MPIVLMEKKMQKNTQIIKKASTIWGYYPHTEYTIKKYFSVVQLQIYSEMLCPSPITVGSNQSSKNPEKSPNPSSIKHHG